MTVIFYSGFYKRRNSTKQPSGGTAKTVALKEGTSMMKPEFLVSTVDWAWNYAHWGARYYYVIDIVAEANELFRVKCELDVLATFKADIGAYSTLISRSSADQDFKVMETKYAAKTSPTTYSTAQGVSDVFTDNVSLGTYVMVTTGKAGNHFYCMSQSTFASVCYWLFPALGMDYVQWGQMNVSQALAGGQDNILRNVVSLKWIPILYSVVSSYLTATNETYIGNWTMPHNNAELAGDTNINISTGSMVFSDRADAGARGEWLYQAPFANYSVYVPPFGKIEIDGTYMKKANLTVTQAIAANLISGLVTLRLYYSGGGLIGVYHANIACEMSSGGTSYNFGGVASSIAGAIAAYASDNTLGLIGGIASAAASAVPGGSQIGGGMSGVSPDLMLPKRTIVSYFDPIEEDNAEFGRPLAKVKTISTIPGFVQCADAKLAIPGHAEEMVEVNTLLNSGIFYE